MLSNMIRPAGGLGALGRLAKYYPNDTDVVNRLAGFLKKATFTQLGYGSPNHLAQALGLPPKETLRLLTLGAHEGVFELEWLPRCPYCNHFAPSGHNHLKDFGLTGMLCGMCEMHFEVLADQTLYLTYRPHPLVMHLPADVPVDEDFLNQWGATPAFQILQLDEFRTYLADLNLPPGESIAVREQTFWFTDLMGSTAMYEKLGDAGAYALVRKHYEILFSTAEMYSGFAVKTIGDGTMGNFRQPVDALRASIAAVRQVRVLAAESDHPVKVRLGLHCGPALIVSLNGRLDFFGTTVNKAARIEAQANGENVVMSAEFLQDPAVQALAAETGALEPFSVALRGLAEPQPLYRLAVV